MNWRASTWLWPYLIGLNFVSYFGSFGGGTGKIKFGLDFIYLALLSLFCLYLAVQFRASDLHVKETMERFEEEIKTGVPSTVPEEKSERTLIS